jgi:adhesin/invasin
MRVRSPRLLLVLFLASALIRCGGDVPTAPGIVNVSVTPPSATLAVGATLQLTSTVFVDGDVSPQAVAFTSDNPGVVSVTAQGLVRALAIGTARVTATAMDGTSTSALLTIVPGAPATIVKSAGDNLTAPTATATAIAPSVIVRDSAGNLIPGVTVTFAVTSGAGTITNGSATTNAAGIAAAGSWTLGSVAGANSLTATVAGLPAVTFTATATAPVPADIAVSGGNGQTGQSGSAVATRPSVVVTTAAGQPAAGVSVTFAVSSGGGTITGASQTTDASGVATVGSWTLGAAGTNTLVATVSGVGTVTFSATAAGSVAAAVAIVTQPSGAPVNIVLTTAPVVEIRDAAGVRVPGAANVISATLSGGGTLSGTTTVAAIDGVATFSDLKVNAAGSYTLTFTSGTLSPVTSASFTIAAAPSGPATQLAILASPSGGTSGLLLSPQPVIQIKDANGAVVAGATSVVVASLSGSGGTLSGTIAVSAVNGVANFTDLTIVGPGVYTLTFNSTGLGSATSGSTTIAASATGTPTSIVKSAGDGQSATVTTAVPTPPAVTVFGALGQPLPGIPVTFAIASGGGTVASTLAGAGAASVTIPTDAAGTATLGAWRLGLTAGPNTLTASVVGVSPVTFTATGTPSQVVFSLTVAGSTSASVTVDNGAQLFVSSSGSPALVDVTATAGGRSVALTRIVTTLCSTCWDGTLDLSGLPAGAYPLTVTAHDVTGATGTVTRTVTKTFQPVATVDATLSAGTIVVGGTSTATAVLKDAAGTTLPNNQRIVRWTSSNPAVASVDIATGVVTGQSAGQATITGTSEGKSGSVVVSVP